MRRILLIVAFALSAAAADKPVFMFVQVADDGALAPKEGSPGEYVLTLRGVAPQTVYFSDRPQRVAGHMPTDAFLKSIGFLDSNPPNAAITVVGAAEGEDTVVVELRRPQYDAAKSTLQYDVTILKDVKGGLAFYDKSRDAKLALKFSNVSLFIDDCPSPATVTCTVNKTLKSLGRFKAPTCFAQRSQNQLPSCGTCTDAITLCTQQFPTDCPTKTTCQAMVDIP